ncbi:MAG: GxxExxY protein [Candidatus Kryptonium sp.]
MQALKSKIIQLAKKVYEELGPFGFIEEVRYEIALAYEFRKNGLKYLEQLQVNIMYDDQIVKEGKVDFIVFDENEKNGILVELKAKEKITGEYLHQLFTYYKAIKSSNSGFPKFISEKINGGLILNWELDKSILLENFKDSVESHHVPIEDVMKRYEREFDLWIVDISLTDKDEDVVGDNKEKKRKKKI